jgi:hypothetical protein
MGQKWYRAVLVETASVKIDVMHVALLVLSTFIGALVNYISSNSPTIASWTDVWPLVRSGAMVGAMAVLALLKDSVLKSSTPPKPPLPQCPDERHVEEVTPALKRMPWGSLFVPLAATLMACTAAQGAVVTRVENIVLQDIALHQSYPQIEQDVAKALAGQVGVDVIVVLQTAIDFLVATGQIPASVLPYAATVHDVAAGKHTAGLTYIVK